MSNETYQQQQIRIRGEQLDKSTEEIKQQMEQQSEFVMDLNNLPKQEHNWIKRGIKLSCEGAPHPHHSHFLFRR